MAAIARATRADLEALLRTRQLDRTLTTFLPAAEPADDRQVLPTGLAALDRQLGGGLPRGQLSEVTGTRSSGRSSLLASLLASTTQRGEVAALIDALDMFDPASAAACDVDLGRLLWVRGHSPRPASLGPGAARSVLLWATVLDQSIKALNLILQAGGFGLVALDVAGVPVEAMQRLPFTTWRRLQRVIEGSRTACVVVGEAPMARSEGGVTIELRRAPVHAGNAQENAAGREAVLNTAGGGAAMWAGGSPGERYARRFLGLEVEARIRRTRVIDPAPCAIRFVERRSRF